jgi:hypothetical protein
MITLLQNLPDDTVGAVASGHVDASDYENVLIPAVEAALGKHKKIKFLYQLGSDFDGFTSGAVWDDMKVGFGHLSSWGKVAIVTDVGWIAGAINLFRFAMPCPAKVFPNTERAEAERWLAA